MLRPIVRVICIWTLLSVFTAVAQDLKCFILTPPDLVLEGMKQIAVSDFNLTSSYTSEGRPAKKSDLDKILGTIEKVSGAAQKNKAEYFPDSGKKLADLLIAEMVQADRGVQDVGSGFLGLKKKEGKSFQEGARTDVFVVIERSRMDQVLEELKLGQTGLIDEATAAQVGKMLGVQTIITGQLNAACKDQWVKETRTTKKTKTEVDCYKRTASVTAAIRIINVETGQLVGTHEASSRQDLKKCEGDYGSEVPPAEMTIEVCLKSVARELADYFVPRFQQRKFEFDKVEGGDYRRYQDLAKKSLENYDLNAAYVQYTAVAEQDPYNYAALYNLGMLHEITGNYKQALEKYGMVTKLVSKDDKYLKALQRVTKQEKFWEQLAVLGVELKEHDFTVSADQVQAATLPKVQVKGGKGDRYEVLKEGSDDAAVLIKVPGGIDLELLGREGDYYKVKLLDGREGFIHKDNAKAL
jgi:hypothetical protein